MTRLIIDPNRQRVFEAARMKAIALSLAVRARDRDHVYEETGEARPETSERYRRLIIAMCVARSTPGGDAIAALARRGYILSRPFFPPSLAPHILPLSAPRIVF